VSWDGLTATVDVVTADGEIPSVADLAADLGDLPEPLSVIVDVSIATEHPVR